MKKHALIALVLILLSVSGACCGCSSEPGEVTFEQLFADPAGYNGRNITIEGFYFNGFEANLLAERLRYSGYAPKHLVTDGKLMWVEGGIPLEIFDSLPQQNMMGPTERIGKLRVTGTFEYGKEYGHAGTVNAQITPSEVEVLPWTPPPEAQ